MVVRLTAALLMGSLLSGCTLINPFVFPDRQPLNSTSARDSRARAFERLRSMPASEAAEPGAWGDAVAYIEAQTVEEDSLAAARARAGELKGRYEAAVGDQAKLNSLMGVALVPLTAAAIGLGATSGSPSAVIALGLTGAAGYGTATWLHSRPRQAAYVAGVKAITCAEDAVKPLDMSIPDRVQLQSDLVSLNIAIAKVEAKAGKVAALVDAANARVAIGAESTAPQLQALVRAQQQFLRDADAHVEAVRAMMPAGRAAYAAGVKVQQAIGAAGGKLSLATDNIAAEVAKLVAETQPDPAALANIINSLGGNYGLFTTVPSQLPPPAAEKPSAVRAQAREPRGAKRGIRTLADDEQRFEAMILADQEAIGADIVALYELAGRTGAYRSAVAARVNPIADGAHFERLKSCGLTVDATTQEITLDPASPYDFLQGKSGARILKIKGGTSGFDARLAAGAVKGVTVEASPPLSRTISIKVTAEAEPGEYPFMVADLSGRSGGGVVKVMAPPRGTEDGAGPAVSDDQDLEATRKALLDKPDFTLDGASYRVKSATIRPAPAADRRPFVEVEITVSGQASRRPTAGDLIDALKGNVPALGVDVAIKDEASFVAAVPVAAGAVTPQSGQPRPRTPLGGFGPLTVRDRQRIQLALCLTGKDVDGIWGPITERALRRYQQDWKPPADGILTAELADAILAEPRARVDRRCGTTRQ